MIFCELRDIRVGYNISINIAPSFLLEDYLSFIPVKHSYFIKPGSNVTNKNKLIVSSFSKWYNHGHFEFALHSHGCFFQQNKTIFRIKSLKTVGLFAD